MYNICIDFACLCKFKFNFFSNKIKSSFEIFLCSKFIQSYNIQSWTTKVIEHEYLWIFLKKDWPRRNQKFTDKKETQIIYHCLFFKIYKGYIKSLIIVIQSLYFAVEAQS